MIGHECRPVNSAGPRCKRTVGVSGGGDGRHIESDKIPLGRLQGRPVLAQQDLVTVVAGHQRIRGNDVSHLGARLLNRTTRSVSLSSIGASYLQTARDVLVQLEEADRAAGLQRLAPHGRLALSAPMSFGVRHVAPHLHTFTRANPEVTVELSLNDRLVDLVEEGFDVAIRIARLADSSLISEKGGSETPKIFERRSGANRG